MARIWTHGVWTVNPGNEQAFVDRWRELAEWTMATFDESAGATLLRDAERENVFYSFGSWPDMATVQRWRETDGFTHRIADIRPLLQAFEPHSAIEEVQLER